MNIRRLLHLSFLIFIFNVLSGCVLDEAQPDDPAFAPVPPAQMQPPNTVTGGIYKAGYEHTLFEDRKARRVGDILTVMLEESTKAKKKAETSSSKDSQIDMANPTIMGTTPKFKMPITGSAANLSASVDQSRSFSGTGDSKQENSLSGSISVTVAEVLPNGNLVIRGEKWLHLNRGKEYIRLSGIVRPEDVNYDNTISSTKVANPRISFSGTGEVAESNVMGWLGRFFSSIIWPF